MSGEVTPFDAMRDVLVARGLLDRAFRLTPAGHAHVDALIAALRVAQAIDAPPAAMVKWRTDARRAGRGGRP